MQRVKCTISYDGAMFAGYQVQPGMRTVQSELEDALTKIHKGNSMKVVASGRTDAGVHAVGQVIHFDTPLDIPLDRWPVVFNSILPNEIVVSTSEFVESDFHARYSVDKKEYRYKLNIRPIPSPFTRHYAYHFPYELNLAEMQKAASFFIGMHDFTSFCSARTDVVDKIRTISAISIERTDEEILFTFTGNGFLYNMVRILTGTLIEVGQRRLHPEEMAVILAKKDRGAAGKTAPAHGLYLWKVQYPNDN
ncbi:tRNA pseudouridine(38-40) synthase TruA [Bacillus sp. 2205SS5-2]|uniref:tRNA pseudouridine(38-40) synthase TruA n=1 Tax=Bacillus sp. 2205SS5-2 TaxID=3109031 RepID=UPI0030059B81